MSFRRQLKNIVRNFTYVEIKVREATSNDPWFPPSSLMTEIAHLTYNRLAFSEIMRMIWKRLNDHGKNWRHVYKSLILLDYLIKTGSVAVAECCRDDIDILKTLEDFHHRKQDGSGVYIQRKAKELVTLLSDSNMLKQERTKALMTKDRIYPIYAMPPPKDPSQSTKAAFYGGEFSYSRGFSSTFHSSYGNGEPNEKPLNSTDMDEETQLQKAPEESKQEMEVAAIAMDLVDVSVESSEPRPHSDNAWHMSEEDVWPKALAYSVSSDPWVSLAQRHVNGRGEGEASPGPRTCPISEAFQGPAAASLVNLDALILTNPTNKSPPGLWLSPTNPFLNEQPR